MKILSPNTLDLSLVHQGTLPYFSCNYNVALFELSIPTFCLGIQNIGF